MSGWIGVDFDGTLCKYDGVVSKGLCEPVPLMLERVKNWLAQDIEVRIVTARVGYVPPMIGQSFGEKDFTTEQRMPLLSGALNISVFH